jgi:hypothetical protein
LECGFRSPPNLRLDLQKFEVAHLLELMKGDVVPGRNRLLGISVTDCYGDAIVLLTMY